VTVEVGKSASLICPGQASPVPSFRYYLM
jgi:hypothetical protein